MKLAQDLLIAFALIVAVGLGGTIVAEEGDAPKPAKATAAEARRIRQLIDDLNTKDLAGAVKKDVAMVDKNASGEELIGMGAVALPAMLEAIQSNKRRFSTKCYLVYAMGRIAKDEQVNVVSPICKLLEGWVVNPRMSKGGKAQEYEGVSGDYVYYTIYKWSNLPLIGISVLVDLKDPKCVPSLIRVMKLLCQRADVRYTTIEKHENLPATFAIEVMQGASGALVVMEDEEANKFIEKCGQSTSPSLRLLGSLAKAKQLLKDDKKAAEEYLQKQMETEKLARINDEYRRFIMENCKTYDEKTQQAKELKDKVKGTEKDTESDKNKERDKNK